jgi:Flp pilus assembly protein TadG
MMRCTESRPKHLDRKARTGAAAVEFALVAPLFFLLLAGMIEFGQAFRIQHCLSAAARQGARASVLEGATASTVIQKVRNQCVDTLHVSADDVTVVLYINGEASTSLADASTGQEIRVTASIPYSQAGVGFYANLFSNSTISASCSFERE